MREALGAILGLLGFVAFFYWIYLLIANKLNNKKKKAQPKDGKPKLKPYQVFILFMALFTIGGLVMPQDDLKGNVIQKESVTSKNIPNIKPVDIYLNLTNKGFKKDGPNQVESTYIWNLSNKVGNTNYNVAIHSENNVNSVKSVQGSVMYLDNSFDPREFLSYISSLPYAGSNPAIVKNWIYKNFYSVKQGAPISLKVGDVYFLLASSGKGFGSISISAVAGYIGAN